MHIRYPRLRIPLQHIRKRRVGVSTLLADLQPSLGVVVPVEELFKEQAHVLEAGVHALAVKGNHGVGGVADDDAGVAVVVGTAFDVQEREVAVFEELAVDGFGADEVGDYAREVGVEEGDKVFGRTCFEV